MALHTYHIPTGLRVGTGILAPSLKVQSIEVKFNMWDLGGSCIRGGRTFCNARIIGFQPHHVSDRPYLSGHKPPKPADCTALAS